MNTAPRKELDVAAYTLVAHTVPNMTPQTLHRAATAWIAPEIQVELIMQNTQNWVQFPTIQRWFECLSFIVITDN